MTISVFQLQQMQARLANNSKRSGEVRDEIKRGVEKEASLHHFIQSECERRGWIALHGSMAHRAMRVVGEWDFVILANKGRIFLIECKAGYKQPSTEQLALHAQAKQLGFESHVVRDFGQFLTIIGGVA